MFMEGLICAGYLSKNFTCINFFNGWDNLIMKMISALFYR